MRALNSGTKTNDDVFVAESRKTQDQPHLRMRLQVTMCYGFSFFLTFVTLTTLTFPSTVQPVHLFLLFLV